MRYILATQQSMTLDEMIGSVTSAAETICRSISEIYSESNFHNYSYLDSRFHRDMTFMICGIKFDCILDKGQVVITSDDDIVYSIGFEDTSRDSVSKALKEYCYDVLNVGGLIRTSALNGNHELTAYTENEFYDALMSAFPHDSIDELQGFITIIRHEDNVDNSVCALASASSFRDAVQFVHDFIEQSFDTAVISGIPQEVNFYYSVVDVTSGQETKNGNVVMRIPESRPIQVPIFDQRSSAEIRDVEGGIF